MRYAAYQPGHAKRKRPCTWRQHKEGLRLEPLSLIVETYCLRCGEILKVERLVDRGL